MGLPQPLVDPLREIEQAEIARPVETLLEATTASLKETVRALSKATGDIEQGAARVKGASRVVQEKAEEEISAGNPSPDLDEHIESIFKMEEDLRRDWLPHIELARKVKAGTFQLPRIGSAEKARLVNTLERFIKATLSVLETLRDLRWNLMTLRAEAEDPGEAPVFDNPQDLLVYLKTPPK
ncbi:MAG: hypothetical protein ABIS20_05290 [Thermoanaerobaculia bacterium]